MKTEPIVKEVVVNASAEKVWKAITDKDEMKQWYFDINEFKPEVGFEFFFIAGDEKEQWKHLCKILEVIPNKKLSYTWSYEVFPSVTTVVTFDLFDEGNNKARVKLTHQGVDEFPKDHPSFKRENFVEGWNHIIGTSLKEFVEKS